MIEQAFRAFVKRADQAAQLRCELEAWSMQLGMEDDRQHGVAFIDVVPSHAYETVVRPAMYDESPLQIGLEFRDGQRLLLTGRVQLQPPVMIGMQVLERIRMQVRRMEPVAAGETAL